jgi:hypothetical protein
MGTCCARDAPKMKLKTIAGKILLRYLIYLIF